MGEENKIGVLNHEMRVPAGKLERNGESGKGGGRLMKEDKNLRPMAPLLTLPTAILQKWCRTPELSQMGENMGGRQKKREFSGSSVRKGGNKD